LGTSPPFLRRTEWEGKGAFCVQVSRRLVPEWVAAIVPSPGWYGIWDNGTEVGQTFNRGDLSKVNDSPREMVKDKS
jgi:hypothetical protein